MAIPTLVVGLGGSGVLTVRALKHQYSKLPSGEVAAAGFLGIDFDRSATESAKDGRLADLEEGEFLYLRPETIQEPLANLDRSLDDEPAWKDVHEWFPSRQDVQIPLSEVEANGAGQFRALGRLGFFVHAEQIQNTLRKSLEALPCEVDTMRYRTDRRVVLVASVAGGTGSGMLIDFAYLARRQQGRPRVYAYLLLPEVFAEVDQGGRIYQNAYAALRELAHFKDQQIPFEGNYWNIPPVSVPAGGEEPFTRIFLFGRHMCPQGGQVVGACSHMAKSILGQLNSVVQEKTLAIVANTASSDLIGKRQRLRTHCFSTAGSHNMPIGVDEINPEVILRQVLLILRDDDRLRQVFDSALDARTDRSKQAFDPSTGSHIGPIENEETQQAKDEELIKAQERAKRLAPTFLKSIDEVAKVGRDRILDWLKSSLSNAKSQSASRYSEKAQDAWKALESLYEILLRGDEQEEEEETTSAEMSEADESTTASAPTGAFTKRRKPTMREAMRDLRENVPPFASIEKSIHDNVSNLLQISQEVQKPREAVLRYLFVSELLENWPFAHLVRVDTNARDALQGLWMRLDKSRKETEKTPWWKKLLLPQQEKQLFALGRAAVLEEALELPELSGSLRALIRARASAALRKRLEKEKGILGEQMSELRDPWTLDLIDTKALPAQEVIELPQPLQSSLERVLQAKAPLLWAEATKKLRNNEDDVRKKEILRQILQRHILADETLRAARFVVDGDDGSVESAKKKLLAGFSGAQQNIFVRRTPNTQRKGFAVILSPEGVVWPDGPERLRRFLETSAEQILECRSEVVIYRGERLWLYFEDLFNPPEHIRNLDDYYRSYSGQAHPELFHIDRRLLSDSNFRQIYAGSHRLVVGCGNDGCRGNIAYKSRTLRTCPDCHRWIRSRCGNAGCTLDEIHRHPKGMETSCPKCDGFNHAAWWRCDQHGKNEVLVPNDKPRCPQCVARHHDDPVAFPEEKIGRRPDTVETIECPHCVSLRDESPDYEPFRIRADLLPFYKDGVNGHDRDRFLNLARERYHLPDDYRCPRCRTALIPIHHREMRIERYA